MNTAITHYEENDLNYKVQFRSVSAPDRPARKANRPSHGQKRSKGPVSFNGIHRRRNKKIR